MPAAWLFDLDGTLIDSEMPWVRAILAWMAEFGIEESPQEIGQQVFGHSWPDIHACLHARHPELPQSSLAEDARVLRRYYAALSVKPQDIVIPSSCAFFRACASFAPCCIVSGSPRADVLMYADACGLSDCLAFALGPEDYAHGKPAPDGYLEAARRLGVAPSQCMVVEDSTPGVAAGVAARMRVLGLNRSAHMHTDFTGCERVVGDLSEVRPEDF